MKLTRCLVIILAVALLAGIGICICTDSRETEKMEEAVML